MNVLEGTETANRVEGIVHLDTQLARSGVDLTVDAVYRLEGPGELDFGGSEFQSADRTEIDPVLRDEDDDYGWWELEEGEYVVRYNESLELPETEFAVIRPLARLMRAGASHGSVTIEDDDGPLEVLVEVGAGGSNWKENFRASRVQVYSAL
ncbi:MAG: deoxycytidine triphosphate deaminase [Bradymonadaceae bacterium]